MKLTKLSGALGAEITQIDSNTLTSDGFTSLRDALFEHGVVVIRDQSLTPDAHIALAERFGTIEINRFFTPVASHPNIAEVRTAPDMKRAIVDDALRPCDAAKIYLPYRLETGERCNLGQSIGTAFRKCGLRGPRAFDASHYGGRADTVTMPNAGLTV